MPSIQCIPLPPVEYLSECFSYDPLTGILMWKVRPYHHFKNVKSCRIFNARYANKKTGYEDGNGHMQTRLEGRCYTTRHLIHKLLTGHDPNTQYFRVTKTLHKRFWEKIINGKNGCWEWSGHRNANGYGVFQSFGRRNINGRKRDYAHRYAFTELVRPIPDDLVLDHLCRNHVCVNPAHLELVTPKENSLRGISPNAKNSRKTHCVRGHAFSGDNLYIRKDGTGRQCLACCRLREHKNRRNK